MNRIEHLIISNKLDFTTDYVCYELKRRKASYLRINRDEFNKYNIVFNVLEGKMEIQVKGIKYYVVKENLKTVYYRAPVYLRDIYQPSLSKEEQLYRTQWMGFVRNLITFDKALWINDPVSTYKAENKLLQLQYAKDLEFLCPYTYVTNSNNVNIHDDREYILKSIEPAILKIGNQEAFVYSNVVKGEEIKNSNLSMSPVIIQEYIYPKIDIRVTVIGSKVYAVRIVKDNKGICGDWRKQKQDLEYILFELPKDVHQKCTEIVKKMNLLFGAIDLVEHKGKFYFIEINPTGEWAWLVDTAGIKIYIDICNLMGA